MPECLSWRQPSCKYVDEELVQLYLQGTLAYNIRSSVSHWATNHTPVTNEKVIPISVWATDRERERGGGGGSGGKKCYKN